MLPDLGRGSRAARATGAEAQGVGTLAAGSGRMAAAPGGGRPAGSARGSLAAATAVIGDPARADQARREFREAALAVGTRPVYDSFERTLGALARAGGFALLPLDLEKVDSIGGALRAGGYRSITNYLERYRSLHVAAGGDWSPALAFGFRGALRAAVRGQGPPRRAATLAVAALAAAGGAVQDDAALGPHEMGAFALVAVWWLLREVEASALTVDAVVDDSSLGGPVALRLGATKTDIQGRGVSRAHRCLCRASPAWARLCPACALRAVAARRRAEGSGPGDPLFPAVGRRGFCEKKDTVRALAALFVPEGAGAVTGHSMRRTGAQLLTAYGVEPWYVEWFGRWGSAAVRAYIEDARARAPSSSGLALAVAAAAAVDDEGAGSAMPSGSEDAARVRDLELQIGELRRLVLGASGVAGAPGAPPEVQAVTYRIGKTHATFATTVLGPRAGRVALCGWAFGHLPAALLVFGRIEPDFGALGCRRCARRVDAMGIELAAPASGSESAAAGPRDLEDASE